MNRRSFVKGILAISAMPGFRLPLAQAANYRGKLFVFVQADGGWDPTSFCDPKANPSGEPTINHWTEKAEIGQAGNIHYAPFGNNRAFFEKYYQRMLVVNGTRRRIPTRWGLSITGAGGFRKATRRRRRCSPRTTVPGLRCPTDRCKSRVSGIRDLIGPYHLLY